MKLSLVLLSGLIVLAAAAPLVDSVLKPNGALVERQVVGGGNYGGVRDRKYGDDDHGHDRDHDHDNGHARHHDHDGDRDRCHYKRTVDDVSSEALYERAVVAASADEVNTVAAPAQLDAEDDEFAPQSRNDDHHPHGWHHRSCYDCPRRYRNRCDRYKRWCRRRHGDGF